MRHTERKEEEKDHFNKELQQTIHGCNRNDIVVVMGDFNAKVGGVNEEYDRCMGRHGMGAETSAIFQWQMAWSSQ